MYPPPGRYEGALLMSSSIRERYDDPSLAHCWVRTHSMVDDLRLCMAQFEECGGSWDKEGLSLERVQAARTKADRSIKPSTYAACSTFFNSSSTMDAVMESERDVVEKYSLGSCCSD